MVCRVLIDENVDSGTAELLRESGHEAVHAADDLGTGAEDSSIADHAREHDYLVPRFQQYVDTEPNNEPTR